MDKSRFDHFIAALNEDRPQALASFAPGFWQPTSAVSPEIMQWVHLQALQASLTASVGCIHAFSQTDFRGNMRAFTVPTLIIHGDGDQSAPLDLTGRSTAQAIPGSQLKIYEGAPHGLMITEKNRLTADLLAFVQG